MCTLSPICLCLPYILSLTVSSVRRVWCVPHHSPRTACYHSNTGDRAQENYRRTEIEWERESLWERYQDVYFCTIHMPPSVSPYYNEEGFEILHSHSLLWVTWVHFYFIFIWIWRLKNVTSIQMGKFTNMVTEWLIRGNRYPTNGHIIGRAWSCSFTTCSKNPKHYIYSFQLPTFERHECSIIHCYNKWLKKQKKQRNIDFTDLKVFVVFGTRVKKKKKLAWGERRWDHKRKNNQFRIKPHQPDTLFSFHCILMNHLHHLGPVIAGVILF